MSDESESSQPIDSKPALLVYPGLEYGETPKSEARYRKVLSNLRSFDVRVQSPKWKSDETIDDKKERIRDEILQAANETGQPVGVLGISASGRLVVDVTRGLPISEVGAVATVAAPLDAQGMTFDTLPTDMQEKLHRQSPKFVEYASQLMQDGAPELTEEELQRTFNIYGKRDKSVPPEHSGLPGAENSQFWTPYMPGKTAILTHAYNIYRGLKSNQLAEFLTEKLKK